MAVYTKLSREDVRSILNQYQLTLIEHREISAGSSNTNFFIQTRHQQLILTVVESGAAEANHLRRLMKLLDAHDFPTTRVIPLPVPGPLLTVKGKTILLKRYIQGKMIPDPEPQLLRHLGAVMAALHEIPPPPYLKNAHTYETGTMPILLKLDQHSAYLNWLKNRYRHLLAFTPAHLPKGLIHGDVFFDNVLFKDGKFTALIDFEEACHHFKIFDLGMALVGICTRGSKIHWDSARALLAGYQDVRSLTGEEKNSLQQFTEYSAVLTSAWRFWKYCIDLPNTKKSHKHLEMMLIAMHAADKSRQEFTRAVFGV